MPCKNTLPDSYKQGARTASKMNKNLHVHQIESHPNFITLNTHVCKPCVCIALTMYTNVPNHKTNVVTGYKQAWGDTHVYRSFKRIGCEIATEINK